MHYPNLMKLAWTKLKFNPKSKKAIKFRKRKLKTKILMSIYSYRALEYNRKVHLKIQ